MASRLQRPGPQPQLSDAEVLCLALASQWRKGVPWDSERGLVRYMQQHGKHWFPKMLQRSAFNARVCNLWRVVVGLQQDIAAQLSALQPAYELVDTLPLPAGSLSQSQAASQHWLSSATVGYGGNHGAMYWGHQALMSVSPMGVIGGWLLGSAHVDDRWLLQGLLSQRHGQAELLAPQAWRPSRTLLAPDGLGPYQACGGSLGAGCYLVDKGFNGVRWHNHWWQRYQAQVLSVPARRGSAKRWPRSWARWFKHLRQPIETVFAVLSEVFGVKRLRAHSLWGLYTRLALAAAAHNLGIVLNLSLGRPALAHGTLIC